MSLCGLIWILHFLPQSAKPIESGRTIKLPVQPEAPVVPIISRTDAWTEPPALSGQKESLSEKLAGKALPKMLTDKEGSSTDLSTLFRGNAASALDLQSDWVVPYLFPGCNLPNLRMRLMKNTETGQYRISGGALVIPLTGLEAGYETELNSEEYKATLQWKKSF